MIQKHTPGPEFTQQRHPFTRTLGAGPFKFLGTYDMGAALRHQQNFGDTAAAFRDAPRLEAGMGTCAHCGHAIITICIIQRGDGKLYGVGTDCVFKTASEGDISEMSKLERQIRQERNRKASIRKRAKLEALMPAFKDALPILATMPHPNEHFASKGKTLKDYYEYIPRNQKNMQAAIAKATGEA